MTDYTKSVTVYPETPGMNSHSQMSLTYHVGSLIAVKGRPMAKPMVFQMTITCLQCDWFAEVTNTSVDAGRGVLEAAHAHAARHEQHALEVVLRLRILSENYVEAQIGDAIHKEFIRHSHDSLRKNRRLVELLAMS